MIIDINHPDALSINIYDKYGNKLKYIQEIDTDTMIGKQIVIKNGIIVFDSTGNMLIQDIDVYKIEGAGLYFIRPKSVRIINTKR